MAQAGYTPILIYASGTATNVPAAGNLTSGASGAELAINYADGKLYYKDGSGNVQLIASKAGASGDVVGPASATDNAIVRFDGTTGKLVQNSVVTIADSTGDISGVGQLNATTVDATNVEVTNIKAKDGTAAATIADSTGVVSITANPILSGGTANGVLYLNGSKVATSGSALTFDAARLSFIKATNGRSWSPDGDDLLAIENSGSANFDMRASTTGGSYVMFSDTDARARGYVAYLHSSDSMPFAVAGSEAMRLTSTGLGIGTSSPATRLHAVGDNVAFRGQLSLQTSTAANFAQITFYDRTTLSAQIYQGYSATAGVGELNFVNAGAASINFYTTNTERMRLDSSGNLGIGTSSPGTRLDVINTAGGFSGIRTNSSVGTLASGSGLWMVANCTNSHTNWLLAAQYNVSQTFEITPSTAVGGSTFSNPVYSVSNAGLHKWFNGTTQALTLDANQNLLLNGTTAGASAVGTLAIFNGTAPTGSVTNGIILYAEDVSSSSELKVRDEAGNVTTLSPHNFSLIPEGPSEDMAWAYYSEKGGKRINVDMLKLARMVEKLTGEKLVYES
jgi:hypothetical protein